MKLLEQIENINKQIKLSLQSSETAAYPKVIINVDSDVSTIKKEAFKISLNAAGRTHMHIKNVQSYMNAINCDITEIIDENVKLKKEIAELKKSKK